MKRTTSLALVSLLLAASIAGAAVLYPPANNTVRFQGVVNHPLGTIAVLINRDGSDGQTSGGLFRFECDTPALGCGALVAGDIVLIQGRLASYVSCRVDGPDNAAKVNFIQRWNGTSWVMVTTDAP